MKRAIGARARLDFRIIVSASGDQFGGGAQHRYRRLLEQAMDDVVADPLRAGVRAAGPEGLWLYHTRHARPRVPPKQRIARPRHLIVFRVFGDEVQILRVLHDAMDLPIRLEDL